MALKHCSAPPIYHEKGKSMGTYLPSTAAERAEMLAAIGCASIDELYQALPADTKTHTLDIGSGLSELELRDHMEGLAAQNTVFHDIFRGAGAYDRFTPALVSAVLSNEKFITAYTPYQAEISQGVLQSIFEYQSMVCELTGMDAANASVYDGATAAAEAVAMCQSRKRSTVVVSDAVHPHFIETVRTYCDSRGVEVRTVAVKNGRTDATALADTLDDSCACLLFQHPNFYGVLEDTEAFVTAAHDAGAKAIMAVEPVSLGILESPGNIGADICVAEGQSLGLPLSFGGPYIGLMACKQNLTRNLPGRIAGETCDADGRRAFVLTLQAREQHIRREKASSNICSNEALCALSVGTYLACMGPGGLAQAARLSYARAHSLADRLSQLDGFALTYDAPFFNEFVMSSPCDTTKLESALAERGILSGLPLTSDTMLWCATETTDAVAIDRLVDAVREVI